MPGLDANTIAYWRCDEATASAMADATGAYNLTVGIAPAVVKSRVGNGRSFNGTYYLESAISTTAVAACRGEWTVEMWIRPSAWGATSPTPTSGSSLLSYQVSGTNDRILFIGQNNTGTISVSWTTGGNGTGVGASSTGVAPVGVWTHVAVKKVAVGDGTYRLRFYFNGVFDSEPAPVANTPATVASYLWVVGRYAGVTAHHYRGDIDEIRVSKVVRADVEILASYEEGAPSVSGGVVAMRPYAQGQAVPAATRPSYKGGSSQLRTSAGSSGALVAADISSEGAFLETLPKIQPSNSRPGPGGWKKGGGGSNNFNSGFNS